MPWRETTDPYAIMVSEVMLQQTQVDRVIPKFNEFVKAFPTVDALAQAEFKEVLSHWSGLGYNRRAKWLHEAAQQISEAGVFPQTIDDLVKLKGIGHNTAAAICAYAFNKPVVYVETNIRAVYIHHFFKNTDEVHDSDILPLVEKTIDYDNPREWYWALMDYGVHLKKKHKNPARKSKHHTKQSTFAGSKRQVRGRILRYLLEYEVSSLASLVRDVDANDYSLDEILQDMEKEGLVARDGDTFSLTE